MFSSNDAKSEVIGRGETLLFITNYLIKGYWQNFVQSVAGN
jgi:hypothetical protein